MSTIIMEGQLFRLLAADPVLKKRGCDAVRTSQGGIAIVSNGHHRGLWVWDGKAFAFTPGSSLVPTIMVETPVEALLTTLDAICPGALP